MDLALRLRVNNSDHRVRGVRMPGSGQLLLYASDALAVLINTTRTNAMMHYVALSRRVPLTSATLGAAEGYSRAKGVSAAPG